MMGRKRGYVLLCLLSSLFAAGCPLGDPVRTTSQLVRLRVDDTAAGNTVSYADVWLKIDFDTAYPLSEETLQPPEEWHKHKREFWKRQPWFRGPTDKSGLAEIEVEHTEIDRTPGDTPPAERDEVTGQPYLIRVKKDQQPEENLGVMMKPGQSVKGKSFTVTVIDIQPPRYVETQF